MKCPRDDTDMVEGGQIGGGMTFAYIASPQDAGPQKSLWLYTRVCPKCGLVETYVRDKEMFEPRW
jgi:hypothetical protein